MPTAPVPDSYPNLNAEDSARAPIGIPSSYAGQISPMRQGDAEFNFSLGTGRNVRRGTLLAGKYVLEEVLGAGAMGVVVSARHLVLNERVAIKALRPEMLDNPEAVARFMREARAAVRIKSEHVTRVTDVGTFDDGAPFMVMEYLDGVDLSTWLKTHGPLPATQAVEFVLQACEAIAEAHVLGIIHRDLKPANLFCTRRRDGSLVIKVLDFGISKVTDARYSSAALSMTDASALMGSPNYMSPEQLQQPREVDHRTDIWSLGVILFELLAGTSPFSGESLPELMINITTKAPKPLRNARPELPAALEAVIERCLRKERAERFGHIGEFAWALRPFGPKRAEAHVERVTGILQSAGIGTVVPGVVTLRAEPDPDLRAEEQTEVTWGQTNPPALESRRRVLMGSFGVVATLGIILLAWTRSNEVEVPRRVMSVTDVVVPFARPAPAAELAGVDIDSPTATLDDTITTTRSHTIDPGNSSSLQAEAAPSARVVAASPSAITAVRATKVGARAGTTAPRRSTQPVRSVKVDAPATISPSPQTSCDPPYTLDDLGRKHFKPECYLNRGQ